MRAEAIRRRMENNDIDSDSGDDEAFEEGFLGGRQDGEDADCYRVPSTNACVTLSNAKSLLYHYCTKLPSDK